LSLLRCISLGAIAALALSGCAPEHADSARRSLPPREVELAPVQLEPLAQHVTAYGVLAPAREVRLGFLQAGRVAEVAVDLGSVVAAGDLLARLDTATTVLEVREAEAAVRQARVRLELPTDGSDDGDERGDAEQHALVRQARALLHEATLRRERARDLASRQLASAAELEAALAACAVAESRLQEAFNEINDRRAQLAQRHVELAIARERLAKSELRAPFAGIVAERSVDAHEFVAAGAPVATLLEIDPLRLRLQLAERDALQVREQQTVRFVVDGDPAEHAGKVVRIGAEIRRDNRTLTVEAEVRNPDRVLRPGRFARARIDIGQPQTRPTVPASAVVSFAGVDRVFVVREDKAVSLLVTTGQRIGERIEIRAGLDPSERVVLDPGDLVGGQTVLVQESR
jgi:RND family efflux transporter MFP subunit